LYIYGVPLNDNIALCPQTDRLLKNIPNVTTAFFSILSSDTVIKEHRGAFKGYLRFHLGVDIPADYENCGIRILNDTYHWQNGKSFIFDDTFLHSAWNKSSQKRTVLYVDFIRPMPKPLTWIALLLTRLISASPYIQNALKNLRKEAAEKDIQKILG
ncbi:MAG: aspartyl/asparaginyl beta-hydroxylase domain-containing protein, partial [Chitinophagales bacterium]|nr:aspartyl/asparaginyl beta-hydroxylase domain-containing protein [Chitinophagales bacterium]